MGPDYYSQTALCYVPRIAPDPGYFMRKETYAFRDQYAVSSVIFWASSDK
jgi:hypothetical protein